MCELGESVDRNFWTRLRELRRTVDIQTDSQLQSTLQKCPCSLGHLENCFFHELCASQSSSRCHQPLQPNSLPSWLFHPSQGILGEDDAHVAFEEDKNVWIGTENESHRSFCTCCCWGSIHQSQRDPKPIFASIKAFSISAFSRSTNCKPSFFTDIRVSQSSQDRITSVRKRRQDPPEKEGDVVADLVIFSDVTGRRRRGNVSVKNLAKTHLRCACALALCLRDTQV